MNCVCLFVFRDGVPYCEKDYQKRYGVKCAYCSRYISGKVLQAGENHHFHPTCARCTKCGDPFGDGEEMYLQGAAIWHPRCGPGPTGQNGIVNGHTEAHTPRHGDSERIPSSASEMQVLAIDDRNSIVGLKQKKNQCTSISLAVFFIFHDFARCTYRIVMLSDIAQYFYDLSIQLDDILFLHFISRKTMFI